VRSLVQPRWLLLHLVTVALIVGMILLGRWQLTVSEHKHFDLRNFGYALQWWLFSGFTVFMWLRVVRDSMQRRDEPNRVPAEPADPGPSSVQYRRYVMPTGADAPAADDPELAAYNDYLARLAAKAKGHGERTS
jgi:DNA-binding transcriptional regulator of glucitol operon